MKESPENFFGKQEIVSSGAQARSEKVGGKESPPDAEAVKNIGVMEDIARARIELEDEILNNGISPLEWVSFWEQKIRPKYPNLRPYEDFFIYAIEVALLARRSVKSLYENTKKRVGMILGRKEGVSDLSYQATNELDKVLFKKIFGKPPKGNVMVEQGVVSLDFLVYTDDDFAVALETNKKEAKSTFGFQFVSDAVKGKGIPVVAVRFKKDAAYTHLHELEHVKNELLSISRGRALDDIIKKEFDPIVKKIAVKIAQRQRPNLAVENWAKDEIIAQVQGEPRGLERSVVTNLIGYLIKSFIHPDGSYFKDYFHTRKKELDKKVPLVEQKSIYQRNVSRSLTALESLLDFYSEDRQVLLGILEQFPLRSWPAVARLLQMRYKKRAEQKLDYTVPAG